jgi:predicted nucleic acid-binding protein
MMRIILLDAGPTGLASQAPGKPTADACRAWIDALRAGGSVVAIPEIARYEVRRELVRAGALAGLRRLDGLHPALAFQPITSGVMDRASELWALVRRAGLPTAPDLALDGDAILAAQALILAEAGNQVLVATTNVTHLVRFPGVVALDWRTIT